MNKRAPSLLQIATIAGFALSCFGILLFLWSTFGGPTPLRARTYELKVPFDEATALVSQSDVRISGVSVGKVHNVDLSPDGKHAMATVDIDDQYAPLPANTRATLRTKTLLGETYIELSPGERDGPQLEDGDTLPYAQVAPTVQLDEILRSFDPQTRLAFRSWMRDASAAIKGQGQSLSYALAELAPAFHQFNRLFRVVDTQRLAVRQLFRNGTTAFQALSRRQGELASLIRNSQRVFQTTARRDRDIEATFRAFPTFLDESKATLNRLREFAGNTNPLLTQLQPAIRQLSPTLVAFGKLAPQALGFFQGLGPVIKAAPAGFRAFRVLFRDDFPPILRALQPFLRNINPLFQGIDDYKRELTALVANATALSNPRRPGEPHFIYVMANFSPESLTAYPHRLSMNRNNAYSTPGIYEKLAKGLPSFGTQQCVSGLSVHLDPDTPSDPAFSDRVDGDVAASQGFFANLRRLSFLEQPSSATVPAPPCNPQSPFKPLGKAAPPTAYQHTYEQQP